MLYIMYWELNENITEAQRLQAFKSLIPHGTFPPKGVKLIRWDIAPDMWGITILEAENPKDIFAAVNMWRASIPGFFKTTKLSPAMPVHEYACPLQTTQEFHTKERATT